MTNSSPTKENDSPVETDTKPASTLARSGTLSWQQRPKSRGGRPLSVVAAQNATQRSLIGSQEPVAAAEQTLSKDQIAQALGSKDPSWFRQTADRGTNSAAYRKNQVEDEDRLDMSSVKAQLPGMSRDVPKQQPSPTEPLVTPTRIRLASPPTLNPPRFDGPGEDKAAGDRISPTGRVSPLRSTSPTKGMGGFVQSAMMKRSDSVKRWSVTSPPGLARVDSVASGRGNAFSSPRPLSMARPGSTTPSSSRPTSRHGERDSESESTPKASTIDTSFEGTPKANEGHIPVSPSKTMDPRRWSPTKSSWLESALNRPESPKPQHKSNSSQPSWMADLNKNKSEKEGPSGTRPRPGSISHKHQVSIGGLMRSSPMGDVAKPNTTGLGGIYSPPPGGNRPYGHGVSLSISKSAPKLEPAESMEKSIESLPEVEPEPEIEPEPEPIKEPKKVPELQKSKSEPLPAPKASGPPPLKPKPETPPKTDFRGSLRHRPTGPDTNKAEEPEFKNVFGNLRRTKTQNYVAPDELKDNILRGKAALAVTGGPKKTERVDEFKEAILQKKDAFKKAQAEGKGVTRTNTVSEDKPLPEGLARRAELGRSLSSKKLYQPESKPAVQPKKADSPKPTPGPKRIPSQPLSSPKVASTSSSPKPTKMDAPKRETERSSPKPALEPKVPPGMGKELNAPFKLQGRVGGRLADRFNPALAGMLARGPPPMSTNGGQSQDESESKGPSGTGSSAPTTEPTAPGPQLTHMTKGRARGPKRKAPTTAAASAAPTKTKTPASRPLPEQPKRSQQVAPVSIEPLEDQSMKEEIITPVEKTKDAAPAPLSIQQQVAATASLRGRPLPTRTTDETPQSFKPSEARVPSFLRKQSTSPVKESVEAPAPLKIQKTGGADSQASSPKKLDMNRMSRFMGEASEGSKPEFSREPVKLTHQRTGSRSPVKMFQRPLPEPEPSSPTKVDRDPVVSVKNAKALFGGASPKTPPTTAKPSFDGAALEVETPTAPRTSPRPLPEVETPKSLRASPRPLPKPKSSEVLRASPRPLPHPSTPEVSRASPRPLPKVETPKPKASPRPLPVPPAEDPKSPPTFTSPSNKSGNDVTALLHDFFGPQQPKKTSDFDVAEVLMNSPKVGGKIKTLGFEMNRIFGDGKKLPVAQEHERMLFDQEMYLCPHNFINSAGWKRSEVYFWVGDEVPESTAEDAHIFIQREVRSTGGTMIKIRQGKETSEFLQALGGVVVIKRGSSERHDPQAPSMLCGRRHLGEVVFDEVDYTATSLCAGFPYLVNQSGKCYLWKGKGSHVDELSCARLVSMDMSLSGELIEVDDSNEPESFWAMLEGGSKPHSADHWRLKPNYPKYCSRLFCSNADARRQVSFSFQLTALTRLFTNPPPQISEVHPFNQSDLSPSHIYILDAFFEIYIIVGAHAQSQYTSFRNALEFAQEYAILASSMEDRPFIPISTVVLEGIPRDLKRVFRKWRDTLTPTATAPAAAGLKRGRSLRVVPLTQALQALSE